MQLLIIIATNITRKQGIHRLLILALFLSASGNCNTSTNTSLDHSNKTTISSEIKRNQKSNNSPDAPLVNAGRTPTQAYPIKLYRAFLFDHIYPQVDPTTLEKLSTVKVTLARDEYEPISFLARSSIDIPEVKAEIGTFKSANGEALPSDSIELRVVKIWNQKAGKDVDSTMPINLKNTPELLLTDDVSDPEEIWEKNKYIAPSFPKRLRTELKANLTKQFWVTVRTKKNTPEGIYKGEIKLLSQAHHIKTIPLEIRVLPYILPKPEKIYGIYFNAHIDPASTRTVPRGRYIDELKSLKEHGFNSIWFYEPPTSLKYVMEAYNRIYDIGFEKGIILDSRLDYNPTETIDSDLERYIEFVKRKGETPWMYAIDEVESTYLETHTELIKNYHKLGAKVVAAIRADTCGSLDGRRWIDEKDHRKGKTLPLDWANVSHAYIPITHPTRRYSGAPELLAEYHPHQHERVTMYWQSYMEDPLNNRLQAGFYLWRSGLDGIYPYASTYNTTIGGMPYHTDFRFSENSRGKFYNTYYPAQGKPTPTLDFEALREGIDDMRYLRKIELLLKKTSTEKAEQAKKALKKIVDPFYYRIHRVKEIDPRSDLSAGYFFWARSSLIKLIAFLRGDIKTLQLPKLHLPIFQGHHIELAKPVPVIDTFIDEASPDTPKDTYYLSLGRSNHNNKQVRSLIRFNLSSIPNGRKIKKASFGFFPTSFYKSGTFPSISIHQVLVPWSPEYTTWINRNKNKFWSEPGANGLNRDISRAIDTITVKKLYSLYELDISGPLREQVKNPKTNYGFMLKINNESKTGNGITFPSRNQEVQEYNFRYQPRVYIEFE